MKKILKQKLTPKRQVFPNAVTMAALTCGVSSLNWAYWGRWEMALSFILLAAVFDFLDGKVARLLGAGSHFGAELDSLSDFVSFGVAPGFLMYQWMLDPTTRISVLQNIAVRSDAVGVPWVLVLFVAMCCALRLARFNTMLSQTVPSYWTHFFMGVPAPAGAGLAVMPLIFSLATHGQIAVFRSAGFVGFFLALSGVMMASRIPTICLKHLHIDEDKMVYLRLALFLLLAGLAWMPWITLAILGVIYLLFLPIGIGLFLKFKKESLHLK